MDIRSDGGDDGGGAEWSEWDVGSGTWEVK